MFYTRPCAYAYSVNIFQKFYIPTTIFFFITKQCYVVYSFRKLIFTVALTQTLIFLNKCVLKIMLNNCFFLVGKLMHFWGHSSFWWFLVGSSKDRLNLSINALIHVLSIPVLVGKLKLWGCSRSGNLIISYFVRSLVPFIISLSYYYKVWNYE